MAGRVCYSGSWLLRIMKFSMPSTWRAMIAFLPSSDSRKARETFVVSESVLGALRSPVASQLYSGMNHHNRPKQSFQPPRFRGDKISSKSLAIPKRSSNFAIEGGIGNRFLRPCPLKPSSSKTTPLMEWLLFLDNQRFDLPQ